MRESLAVWFCGADQDLAWIPGWPRASSRGRNSRSALAENTAQDTDHLFNRWLISCLSGSLRTEERRGLSLVNAPFFGCWRVPQRQRALSRSRTRRFGVNRAVALGATQSEGMHRRLISARLQS